MHGRIHGTVQTIQTVAHSLTHEHVTSAVKFGHFVSTDTCLYRAHAECSSAETTRMLRLLHRVCDAYY